LEKSKADRSNTIMSDRKKEAALENLKLANKARQAKQSNSKPTGFEDKSRLRLEKIIEKTEKELVRACSDGKVDPAKLTQILKVSHQNHRQVRGEEEAPHVRTSEDAQRETDNILNALYQLFRKLPPASKAEFRKSWMKILGEVREDPRD
jgi:hypothetical protein